MATAAQSRLANRTRSSRDIAGILRGPTRRRAPLGDLAAVEKDQEIFAETFTLVTPSVLDLPACRDPDDDLVLVTAVAGRCSAVITGDQNLLVLDR
jgi:PIN domain